ncbi:serine/threonine protein kinase [Nocardioides sp. LHG3406-4]|uniref:serine/threonine protein kinase n=1 Tax=Nocardioides sp. LHG3406-4 TaxID=2804575 RepID=UPI003CE8F213
MSAPVIPGFTFVEHLGSGGFADVFLYEQDWPRQRVAVKVVRPDVPLDEREKGLFAAEANAMARLADHPYIVSVITAGITHDSGRPFLVMRYCPPPDLGVRVRSNPMAPIDAISTGIKLSSAIETAHRSGILHRDIKPSNVLVTTYHEPALTDFGIAGHIHDVAGESDVRISYPWSPPEMLDGRSNGSVHSDVYSLGATIWHLLVGRSPFSIPNGDNSTRALSARILHAAPPATQRPDVPPALDRLLQQCLAKNPAHRPQSALELARSLQRIEADAGFPRTAVAVEGDRADAAVAKPKPETDDDHTVMKAVTVISASGPRTVAPTPPDPDDAPSRSGVVWAVVAALVLVAIVGGLLLKGGGGSDEPDPGPSAPSTPIDLIPSAVDQPPTLSADRTPRGVRFRWTAQDAKPGDQWLLQRLDTDAFRRTTKQSALIRADKQVCVEVRLQRDGDDSPVAQACA